MDDPAPAPRPIPQQDGDGAIHYTEVEASSERGQVLINIIVC